MKQRQTRENVILKWKLFFQEHFFMSSFGEYFQTSSEFSNTSIWLDSEHIQFIRKSSKFSKMNSNPSVHRVQTFGNLKIQSIIRIICKFTKYKTIFQKGNSHLDESLFWNSINHVILKYVIQNPSNTSTINEKNYSVVAIEAQHRVNKRCTSALGGTGGGRETEQ